MWPPGHTANARKTKMSRARLDQSVHKRGLTATRSQAESYIRMGAVQVNGKVIKKPGFPVGDDDKIKLTSSERYVSRAGLKLASVAELFNLDFRGRTVLDVGSSTGGFTDYALQHGAVHVIAVDVGTEQLHPSLRSSPKVELHEQTDIRELSTLSKPADIVVIDVSFISLREILPAVARLAPDALIAAMVKPQFEAANSSLKHKGVIKNEKVRREILRDFEAWVKPGFKLIDKADSQVSGEKGNKERFYLLTKLKK
jgi:23S rRNA (cytidine1920-2'-O)/16S rRNA (cytidine1409-2'-O)-methyltransferase